MSSNQVSQLFKQFASFPYYVSHNLFYTNTTFLLSNILSFSSVQMNASDSSVIGIEFTMEEGGMI